MDSAYLALVATQELGNRALCVTADSASYPDRHRRLAMRIAETCGLNHEIIRTDELARPEYRSNPANRCYYCKHELYTHLTAIAQERGIAAIADGSNADDRGGLSSRAPGGAGVRRDQSARCRRAHEERDSRAVATGGASNLG